MVKLVKFAPLGERSAGGALSQYQYRSFPLAETNAAMNDATMLVVMLETVAALEHVEEIIAVDGVDMLLVGSNDLCNEMGITGQYDHPRLRDAFARAIAAATAAGKHVGVGGLASRNDLMTQFVRDGRALCLHRHRHGVPAGGLRGEGEIRARYRRVTTGPGANALGRMPWDQCPGTNALGQMPWTYAPGTKAQVPSARDQWSDQWLAESCQRRCFPAIGLSWNDPLPIG